MEHTTGRNKQRKTDENHLYTVGELCIELTVTRKTLFYYDRIGLLTPTKRSGAQQFKLYDAGKMERLRQILIYRDAGLCIAEIRELLDDRYADRMEILHEAMGRLISQEEQVEGQLKKLQVLIEEEEAKTGGS